MFLNAAEATGCFIVGGNDIPAGPVTLPGYDTSILVAHHRNDLYDGLPETVIEVARETIDIHDHLNDQIQDLYHQSGGGTWNGQIVLESHEGLPLRRIVVRGSLVVVETARMAWPDGTVV